jgi:hypothetical protein
MALVPNCLAGLLEPIAIALQAPMTISWDSMTCTSLITYTCCTCHSGAGLLEPSAGSIHVCGIDVTTRPGEAARLIGICPQVKFHDQIHDYDHAN